MSSLPLIRRMVQAELFKSRSLVFLSRTRHRNYSKADEIEQLEEENLVIEADEEEEALLERFRNVSGLSHKQQQQYSGSVVQPPFKDLQRRRKMYALYGAKSGEDPRQLWPSRQELNKMQEDDLAEEVSLSDKIQIMQDKQSKELTAKLERRKTIEKNMAQMSKMVSEYYKKVDAADAELQKRKEKKEALLDEARDFFGYRVKANDPKFQQMVEEKEERERKEAKELKKKEKARKLAERLKQDVLAMKRPSGEEKSSE